MEFWRAILVRLYKAWELRLCNNTSDSGMTTRVSRGVRLVLEPNDCGVQD